MLENTQGTQILDAPLAYANTEEEKHEIAPIGNKRVYFKSKVVSEVFYIMCAQL